MEQGDLSMKKLVFAGAMAVTAALALMPNLRAG
jgi:hypothetical protein